MYFIINFVEDEQPLPKFFVGRKDLLSGKELDDSMTLKQYDVVMISIPKQEN